MPCEVLAGVAISEDQLWNLVKAVRSVEREYFGDYLCNLGDPERKGRKLLKRKRFRSAGRCVATSEDELPQFAHCAKAFLCA